MQKAGFLTTHSYLHLQGITRISFKVKSDIFSAALKGIISQEEISLFSRHYFQVRCSDDVVVNFHCQNSFQMLSENRFKRLYRYLNLSLTFLLISYQSLKAFRPSAVVVCHPCQREMLGFMQYSIYSLKQSKQNTDACRCITLINFLVFSIRATAKFAKKTR